VPGRNFLNTSQLCDTRQRTRWQQAAEMNCNKNQTQQKKRQCFNILGMNIMKSITVDAPWRNY